jgi:type IV secretory pathway VirB10-like protein
MKLKPAVLILVSLFVTSALLSQTLAEIAQKERERRASLKGKKAVVVTNADLARLKKKPALEIPIAPVAPPAQESAEASPPAPAEEKPEKTPPSSPPAPVDNSRPKLSELQQRWEKAKEYVELLTLKMGALWQEFNNLTDQKAKEAVQQAIGETFVKLQAAQEEEAKARQELEKSVAETRKDSVPAIWIK